MDNLLKIHKFISVIESLHSISDSTQKIALDTISDGFFVCHGSQLNESIEEKLNFLVDSNVDNKEKANIIKNAIANAGDLKTLFLRARKMMKDSSSMQRAKQYLESSPVVLEAISGNANDMLLGLVSALGLAPAPVMEPVIQEPIPVQEPIAPEQIVEQIPEEVTTEVVEQPVEQPVETEIEEEIVETAPAQEALPESIQNQINFIKKFL